VTIYAQILGQNSPETLSCPPPGFGPLPLNGDRLLNRLGIHTPLFLEKIADAVRAPTQAGFALFFPISRCHKVNFSLKRET